MQIQSLLERLRPYGNGTRSAESTSPAQACTAEDLKQWVYTNAAQSQADHWLHSTCNLAAYKPHLFAVIAELSQVMPLHTNEELRLGPALFQGGLGHSQTTGMPKLILNNGKAQVLEHDKAILELLAALLNTETEAFRMQIKKDLESGRDLGCAQVDRLVQKLKSESRCTTINSKANAYALNNESVRYISQSQNQRSNNPTSEQALKYLIQNLLTIKRIGHESETENLPLVDIYRGDTEDFSQGSESIFNRIACNDPQQFDQGKHLHFDTFLPSVARTFEYLNDRDAQDGDCHWAVKLEGCWVPISDINQVVDYVISTARGHLEEFRNEGSVHENDLYPIELYITAAYLDKQTPHSLCIQACEQKAHKVSLKMTSFEEAETLRKSKVDEAQRLTREEKAAMEAERLSKARELGLPDNTPSSAVRLAIEGASPETAKSSSSWCQRIDDGDHREIYSEVQSKFENTHQWRDMSSKNRKPEYLRRTTGLPIDNECWLRAAWFSLLNQLPSPEYTTGKMNAMFGERWTEHEYLRLLPILIKAYRENPQQFCFHEEDRNKGLNNVGIYFRSGTPSVQVLQELGYAEDRGRLSTFDTESHMKFAASYILPAFRKERPLICLRADELRMSMGLQSSDTALLLHRAFGLECLVLEFSTEGGVTAQVSSQHGSAVDEYMKQFDTKGNTAPEFKKAELNRLIDYFADRPILILRQDHFMVQMPKGARYDPYVANVVINPQPHPWTSAQTSAQTAVRMTVLRKARLKHQWN